MPRFYFHLRDHTDSVIDPEGQELPDLQAAERVALEAARDTLSQEMKGGFLDLRYRIEVEDEAGTVIYSLQLKDSFAVRE
ncbi:hypothetical protein QUC32_03010 [Novosphingobium resinovorum]|uniref:DUF6894 family protein n=1 Tax=Novosphingobium TaxID=165696 RepID=UPI001B3C567E|nr:MULTISPECIES: hypothetical protein [Novosphingobium]MBF7013802.1 hypothetical protein [Novosphingobium sp. HR1a]WJM25946.1 hypothetical protein QUC32_03010 [Novosphingobium resinovorum]